MKDSMKNVEQQLKKIINDDRATNINSDDKEQTIAVLKAYMPIQQESSVNIMKKLFVQSLFDIVKTAKWSLFLTLVVLLAIYTFMPENSQQLIFFVATPIPLFLIGWQLNVAQHESMVELEMTYKHTFQQLLFAKMVVIIFLSISAFIVNIISFSFIQSISLLMVLQLAISGLTPILLLNLALLYMSLSYRASSTWGVLILVWALFGMLLMYTPICMLLFSISNIFYIAINIAVIALLVSKLNKVWRMEYRQNADY